MGTLACRAGCDRWGGVVSRVMFAARVVRRLRERDRDARHRHLADQGQQDRERRPLQDPHHVAAGHAARHRVEVVRL